MFKRILCPIDGSEHAERALALAIDLALKYNAALVLMHSLLRNADTSALQHFAEVEGLAEKVHPEIKRLQTMEARLDANIPPSEEDAISSRLLVNIGQHLLDDAKVDAREKGIREIVTLVVDGDPADRILRGIKEHEVDCVVMGSRGLSDLKGLFLGSVSHKVTNRAPCTVIAVK
ncbi:MAG: universal stress protein [Sedimenticola sp.]|nr:universal stress protein [Sedimenticola sp.]